jgi:hypothetical protein
VREGGERRKEKGEGEKGEKRLENRKSKGRGMFPTIPLPFNSLALQFPCPSIP